MRIIDDPELAAALARGDACNLSITPGAIELVS
jgi:hypothetical protein